MNWLNFQELNIVRDLTARLLSQPCYKTRKVNKEMFKLYLLDDRQTYRFRAGVHCVSSKAVTLGNLEIFYNDKFEPLHNSHKDAHLYYLRYNDLCEDIEPGMYIEFDAEIGEIKIHDEDVFIYDNDYDENDYMEDYGEDVLCKYSIIEALINTIWTFQKSCLLNGEAAFLHRFLRDVYGEGIMKVLVNPSNIKILGESELTEFETHTQTLRLFRVRAV